MHYNSLPFEHKSIYCEETWTAIHFCMFIQTPLPTFFKNLFPNIDIYENYFHLRIKIRLSTKKYLGTPNYNLFILALV